MTFARFNFVPLVALYGLSFFLWKHLSLVQRAALFSTVGSIAGGILCAYILLIHVPSTGVTTLSCITGTNLLQSLEEADIPVYASNGPRSAHYAKLLTLQTDRDMNFYESVYPNWHNPNSWVSEREKSLFLSQPYGEVEEDIRIVFSGDLYYILGPCEINSLLYGVYQEAVAKNWPNLIAGTIRKTFLMLLQLRLEESFPNMYLDAVEDIDFENGEILGFQRAHSSLYNGHLVWRPGMTVFSALFAPLNLLKLLTPFAVAIALLKRDWLLVTVSITLLIGLLTIAALTNIEPRYYSFLAPLYSILIGWFLAETTGWIKRQKLRRAP